MPLGRRVHNERFAAHGKRIPVVAVQRVVFPSLFEVCTRIPYIYILYTRARRRFSFSIINFLSATLYSIHGTRVAYNLCVKMCPPIGSRHFDFVVKNTANKPNIDIM